MSYTDTHCHLDYEQFDADRDQVIARAIEAGVDRMLNPGLDLESSQAAIGLAANCAQVYAAVGVHPNSGKSWAEHTLDELRVLAQSDKVVAIGEIGLDYYRDWTPRYVQEQVFWHHLELARELERPVIIHNRDASGDMMRILAKWHAGLVESRSPLVDRPGVLHSFSAGLTEAQNAVAMNFYIGFTGPVTFKSARELQEIAAALPLENILVETDAPFLTPHPYRGQRNEPMQVKWVVEKIAELRHLSPQEVAEVTTRNAARLFQW